MLTLLRTVLYTAGAAAAGAVITREYVKGSLTTVDPNIKVTGKVAIVTGSSSGVGKETAKELAKRGAIVYLACRNAEKCLKAREEIIKESKNEKVHCRSCDLEDFMSIASFAEGFKKEQPRLDILINNAALVQTLFEHTESNLTSYGIEKQLATNHVGHFYLTSLLLDHLKKSAPSRIVVVTCYSHAAAWINFDDLNSEKSYLPLAAYDQSKLANVLFVKQLVKRLEGTGVTVNAVNPGVVATELGRKYHLMDNTTMTQHFTPVFEFIAKTPSQGAQTSVYAAVEPTLERVTGKYFSNCKEDKPARRATLKEDAEDLWALTNKLIREKSQKG